VSLAAVSLAGQPKERKRIDIPVWLPRGYMPASVASIPIDKTLLVGIVPPVHDRETAATWTNPVAWSARSKPFFPKPPRIVTEVEVLYMNVAGPVTKALPGIMRRLFPRTKVLTTPDCPACDLMFVATTRSVVIPDQQHGVAGMTVWVTLTAIDRSGTAVASFVGEGANGRTNRMHWTASTATRALATPALEAAMESLFSRISEDAAFRTVTQDKLAERARPSEMETTAAFDDTASFFPNGRLDAGESAHLRFRIRNQGAGPAFGVRLRLSATPSVIDVPPEVVVGDLAPGGVKELDVPLSARLDVPAAVQQLRVETLEKRGYGGRPVVVQLATGQLQKPTLKIADIRIEDRAKGDGDGRPSNGETVEAVILVSNSGPGDAAGATVTVSSPPGIDVLTSSFTVGALPVNGVKELRTMLRIPIPFAGPEIGLDVRATEIRGAAVASVEEQRRWPLYRKKPQIDVAFRLFDGNSARSRGNRDGVANNGETLEVTLIPNNRGTLAARDVRLAIASPVSGVAISPATIEIGELPPLAEGEEHRIQVTVPRAITDGEVLQRLLLNVAIAQADFGGTEQAVGLPFRVQRPALVAAVASQSDLIEGKTALFVLDITNDGPLAAEDVKIEATSDNPAIELLDSTGKPTRTLRLDLGSVAAATAARRIQLKAYIRRNIDAVAAMLTVSVSQRDFGSVGAQTALTIRKEEAAVIPIDPGVGPDRLVDVRPASAPATVSFQGYRDERRVAEASIRFSFEVQAATDIKMVRLEQNHRTIELPDIVPIRNGSISVWQYELQVQLDYGPNHFEVVVITAEGLRSSRSMTLHREKPRGRIWLAVVGISSYRDPAIHDLSFAREDAVAVRTYYREQGVPDEQIIEILDDDATLANIKRRLGTELVKRAANPDDTVVIYFAGHGVMEPDRSSGDSDGYSKYLMPHDATPSDLFGSALSMEELSRIVQRLRAERVVLIIDSCFSGAAGGRTPFEPNAASRGVITDEFLARIASTGKGRVILTASGSREVAQESSELRHGVFTYFLLEGLRGAADLDRDEHVDVDEIYKYVSQKVITATRGRQNPMRKSPNLTGTVFLGGRLQ
jgi:hypothetical protein